MKVIPTEKIMSSRSAELSIVKSPKAPTWRASCRCLMTGNSSWGYPGRCSKGFGVDLLPSLRGTRGLCPTPIRRPTLTVARSTERREPLNLHHRCSARRREREARRWSSSPPRRRGNRPCHRRSMEGEGLGRESVRERVEGRHRALLPERHAVGLSPCEGRVARPQLWDGEIEVRSEKP